MGNKKKIVFISASFAKAGVLFDWIKKFSKKSDDHFVYWDEFAFTTESLLDYDAILIFNNPSEKILANSFPEKIMAFMMEPGCMDEHPWMFKNLEQYATVYSPLQNSANTTQSHGFLGWHLLQDWHHLSGLAVPEKAATISCIASNLTKLKGHKLRVDFIKQLQKAIPAIDFFGRGSNFLPDKMSGLLPYRYSIAMENSSIPYYFTEKINDCFLAYTVPLYHGCKNIGKYFPEKSFIQINIEEPLQAIEKIQNIMAADNWHQRFGALQEARELVLNKYQPLAAASAILRQIKPGIKAPVLLNPVLPTITRRIKNIYQHLKKYNSAG
jgi:hypothetical protein